MGAEAGGVGVGDAGAVSVVGTGLSSPSFSPFLNSPEERQRFLAISGSLLAPKITTTPMIATRAQSGIHLLLVSCGMIRLPVYAHRPHGPGGRRAAPGKLYSARNFPFKSGPVRPGREQPMRSEPCASSHARGGVAV